LKIYFELKNYEFNKNKTMNKTTLSPIIAWHYELGVWDKNLTSKEMET
jgi:hypothetical protein